MSKSPDAFRTISEVADWLGIQAHVLRFWESKFTQVKPIKRAGGRRYYRPADMLLLGGIKKLLHDDGLTIKGVQKILREDGMSHVSALSQPLDDADMEAELAAMAPTPEPEAKLIDVPEREPESVVLPFEPPMPAPKAPAVPAKEDAVEEATAPKDAPASADAPETAEAEPAPEQAKIPVSATPDPVAPPADDETPVEATSGVPSEDASEAVDAVDAVETDPTPEQAELPNFAEAAPSAPEEDTLAATPDPTPEPAAPQVPPSQTPEATKPEASAAETTSARDNIDVATPEAKPEADAEEKTKAPETDVTEKRAPEPPAAETSAPEPQPAAPKARDIGMPDVTPEDEIHAEIATLTRASRVRAIDAATAQQMAPLLAQLTALRDRMAARRTGA